MHDVLIVGGSVAGAATAVRLARRGYSVMVVERAVFPRRKPCGEGLLPYGVAELGALGIDFAALEDARWLTSLRFHADGVTAGASFPAPGALGIRRDLLDTAILRRAVDCGVEIRTGVTAAGLVIERGQIAAVRTSDGDIQARAVVAADGVQSRLRRLAGLDRPDRGKRYGVAVHASLAGPAEAAVDVYFHDGYEVYRTPVGGNAVNIAILAERAQMRSFGGDPVRRCREVLQGHPAVDGGPFQFLDQPLVAGPFPRACRRGWRANLVLVGDAFGFFDGISGDGMSSALTMARLCADSIVGFLETGSYGFLRRYDRCARQVGRNGRLLARVSLALAGWPAAARQAVANLARHPETFARLAAITASNESLTTLRPVDLMVLGGSLAQIRIRTG